MTYSFIANNPGTFLYQSGTDPAKQVRMGLFGAMIVRPIGHPDWVNNSEDEFGDPYTKFNPDTEEIVEVPVGESPYTYSDMTGMQLQEAIPPV